METILPWSFPAPLKEAQKQSKIDSHRRLRRHRWHQFFVVACVLGAKFVPASGAGNQHEHAAHRP